MECECGEDAGGSAGQAKPAADKAEVDGTATDQTGAVVADAKAVLTNSSGEKIKLR